MCFDFTYSSRSDYSRSALSKLLSIVFRVGYISVGSIDDAGCHNPRFFAQVATIAAYRKCGPWLDELLESVRRHADQLTRTADELPGLTMGTPEGTYLAWLDFRGTGLNDAQFEELLAEQQLAFTPGIEFGNGGSGFMRVNLAVPDELFDEAMTRLRKALA